MASSPTAGIAAPSPRGRGGGSAGGEGEGETSTAAALVPALGALAVAPVPARTPAPVPLPSRGLVVPASAPGADAAFEELLRERARVRRQKDEHSVAELRVQLDGMERALSAEIRRRIELNRTLERRCSERLRDMEGRVGLLIEERAEAVRVRVEAVEVRAAELGRRLEEEAGRVPRDIERRGRELAEMLAKVRDEMDEERSGRLGREGRILRQIAEHREHVEGMVRKEREARAAAVGEVREMLERAGAEGEGEGATLEERVLAEAEELRELAAGEARERRAADDEIVAALNRYTDQLQRSLAASMGE